MEKVNVSWIGSYHEIVYKTRNIKMKMARIMMRKIILQKTVCGISKIQKIEVFNRTRRRLK